MIFSPGKNKQKIITTQRVDLETNSAMHVLAKDTQACAHTCVRTRASLPLHPHPGQTHTSTNSTVVGSPFANTRVLQLANEWKGGRYFTIS